MSTGENETQVESSFEQVTQKVLHWIVDRIPVANNIEKEWIRSHIDALYVDPDAAKVDPNAGQPVDQPAQTGPPPVPVVTSSGGNQVNNGVTEEIAPATETTAFGSPQEVAPSSAPIAVTEATAVGMPASYPVNGSAEDIRNWYANATDDEINQLNSARASQV